ncbi:MFS transporter [Streptomyces sp. NTH33]|uniref:MFS transporter n=1 Tax=Streptomyces sp. NTH33 TaxID=1735453 RepID=UPI000DAA1856|nr:MFS transporter [Streptomyces sp. NTH33]PZH15017.1 MFS transporter [Streptomyces sp. NTH33]
MTTSKTSEALPPRTLPAASIVRGVHWTPVIWLLLVVVCGAVFLDGLDTSMMGVALPSIGRSLHLEAGSLQWIVSGYVLGYGGLLLLGGRTADLVSRRAVFLVAVSVFGVASVISAALSDEFAIIALRFVKGVAAGFTVPAGLSILTTIFAEGPARNRALRIYTLCVASGYSLGLVIGGLLTEIGWRATLLLPGPVALTFVAIGFKVIPKAENTARVRLAHFDLGGALTVTGSLLVLVYAVVEAPTRGWGSVSTLVLLAVSAALMAAFIAIELRHERPLLRLGILRNSALVHANMAGFAISGGYAAFQFIATLYVQNALGWSPIGMAMAFLPAGAVVILVAPRLGPVVGRLGTPTSILLGLLSCAVAYGLFLRTTPSMPYAEFLLPTMILFGVGFSLGFASLNVQATAGVAGEEQGLASGLVNTSLQVGTIVVIAVVSAVLGSGTPVHGQLLPGMRSAVSVIVGVLAGASLLTAAFLLRRRGRATPSDDAAVSPEAG